LLQSSCPHGFPTGTNPSDETKFGLGYYEMQKHMPWVDEGFPKLLHQRKKVKLQWFQNTSEVNGENMNNARSETSRHFRDKKRKYLKDKINELATNSQNKNIRDLYRGIN
jgi:hypothetical protein